MYYVFRHSVKTNRWLTNRSRNCHGIVETHYANRIERIENARDLRYTRKNSVFSHLYSSKWEWQIIQRAWNIVGMLSTGWLKNNFRKFGGRFLTSKQGGGKFRKQMFANVDKFHGLHVLQTCFRFVSSRPLCYMPSSWISTVYNNCFSCPYR